MFRIHKVLLYGSFDVNSLEGVVEQEDVEAQGLAYSTNPHSATFLGVILG